MKIKNVILLIILVLLPVQMEARRLRKKHSTQTVETTYQVDANNLKIGVDYMNPRRWNSRSVSAGYGVELKEGMVDVHLPYMGVVYQPDFERDGLNFSVPVIQQGMTAGKKGSTMLTLTCRRGIVSYQLRITIWPNGKASIYLQPSNADSITYDGEVEK